MNYNRRQEIEKRLPKASEPCIRHVNDLCLRAGMSGITRDDYIFIHRAFIDYLLNSPDGKTTMLKILGADVIPGSYEKQYYPENQYGMPEHALDHTKLFEYKGWLYNGRSGPHSKIEVQDTPNLVECESCHAKFPNKYCAVTVKSYSSGRERLETLCNYCRLNNNDMRVRSEASGKVCTDCTFKGCSYHPSKQARMAAPQTANPVVAAAMGTNVRQLEYQPGPPVDQTSFSMI